MGAGLGDALALMAGYVVVTSVAVPVGVLLLVDRRVRLEAQQPGRPALGARQLNAALFVLFAALIAHDGIACLPIAFGAVALLVLAARELRAPKG